ncbi:aminotransferase class V-fold PLP-dependent enzyme [Rhodoferax sp.]|uniref:pyridoxal phosphate-dependent decarboxylase family protein n=1 Tax=Rhodoferax sp. TaxID=50421 RepID=UPI0025F541BE|nr:aminotransferase class V-fold PLP-dependent enzyme [Rhodoferax sp.]MCM2340705.1 aminotransferase class V-fold PLP-dependent enzyme [Rhodoferax sp.]
MQIDHAETANIEKLISRIGAGLDQFLKFEHEDCWHAEPQWRAHLDVPLPHQGVGIDQVIDDLVMHVIPNGSAVPKPGFTSFITTGATSASVLASTAASIAAPQRYLLNAFNLLEDVSLRWLASMCHVGHMQGVYSSGGSVANLLALGAARQFAFEKLGHDAGADGISKPVHVYASAESHHTIQRSAGVLGIGRRALQIIACDSQGRMRVDALGAAIEKDNRSGIVPMAIVASAGTTNTGAIDPLKEIGEIAKEYGIWFHVDGAYGLPGILDERIRHLYDGLEMADSVIVDPHKWLGASVGVAATFVRDRQLLYRAFTQEPADYLEGAIKQETEAAPRIEHSMDDFGVPYYDYGVELSSPCRGVVVWAMLREIGVEGMTQRVKRHNDMAGYIAMAAKAHPNLELLLEPTLSICCFRYVAPGIVDLDAFNRQLHRRLIRENQNLPSTTQVNGKLALRPCFVGARTNQAHAEALLKDVLRIGQDLAKESIGF